MHNTWMPSNFGSMQVQGNNMNNGKQHGFIHIVGYMAICWLWVYSDEWGWQTRDVYFCFCAMMKWLYVAPIKKNLCHMFYSLRLYQIVFRNRIKLAIFVRKCQSWRYISLNSTTKKRTQLFWMCQWMWHFQHMMVVFFDLWYGIL